MLTKSIAEFKRLACTEGVASSFRFAKNSVDKYFFSPLLHHVIYNRMQGYIVANINKSNIRIILRPNDIGISQELLRKGTHEPLSTKIFMGYLQAGMRIVDVGANLGYFALQEAQAVGKLGRVYAIEPIPQNYFMLKHSVALNQLDNIELYNFAIGDTDGTLSLFTSDASNWAGAIKTSSNGPTKITVPCKRLDTFLRNKDRIDVVRMDVEGFEPQIINGMAETLQQKGLLLFMEIHPICINSSTYQTMLQTLATHDFEPLTVIVGTHNAKQIKVSSMKELAQNNYLRSRIYHGFFKN